MKKLLLFTALVIFPFLIKAQQKAQYSQYVINSYLLNPALTGIEEYADVKLGYRQQWAGVKGAPVTFYLSGHARLDNGVKTRKANASKFIKPQAFAAEAPNNGLQRKIKPFHGVGGVVLRDQIGPFSRTEASASYAYHLPLASNVRLATGASLGVISQTFRADAVTFANTQDNANVGWNKMTPNISTGLWLYGDNFYAGASANQLFANVGAAQDDRPGNNTLRSHYFITGAYKFAPSPTLAFIPSVLVKWIQPVPVSVDYNLRAIYDDKYWLGASYRQQDSFSILAGLTLNHRFDLSYAYDLGVSSLSSTSTGSHEIVLGLRLQKNN